MSKLKHQTANETSTKQLPKQLPKIIIANGWMYWVNVGIYMGIGFGILSVVLSCPVLLLVMILSA